VMDQEVSHQHWPHTKRQVAKILQPRSFLEWVVQVEHYGRASRVKIEIHPMIGEVDMERIVEHHQRGIGRGVAVEVEKESMSERGIEIETGIGIGTDIATEIETGIMSVIVIEAETEIEIAIEIVIDTDRLVQMQLRTLDGLIKHKHNRPRAPSLPLLLPLHHTGPCTSPHRSHHRHNNSNNNSLNSSHMVAMPTFLRLLLNNNKQALMDNNNPHHIPCLLHLHHPLPTLDMHSSHTVNPSLHHHHKRNSQAIFHHLRQWQDKELEDNSPCHPLPALANTNNLNSNSISSSTIDELTCLDNSLAVWNGSTIHITTDRYGNAWNVDPTELELWPGARATGEPKDLHLHPSAKVPWI